MCGLSDGGSQAEQAWGRTQPRDALWKAARAGDLASCTRLLGAGTHPVGWKNPVGMQLLHRPLGLAATCCTALSDWQVLQSDSWGKGACQRSDIPRAGRQSMDGWTPLHVASNNGHLEVARLLLEFGADVNAKVTVATTGCHLLYPPRSIWQLFQSNRWKGAPVI